LEARRDHLNAAWGIADRNVRRAALRQAWKDYRDDFKAAVKELRKTKKDTWKNFYQDRKDCRATGASDDHGTEGEDAQL